MNNNGICSLEFVATHEDFQRQGFAKAICAFAMKEAFAGGQDHYIESSQSWHEGTVHVAWICDIQLRHLTGAIKHEDIKKLK